MTARPNAADAHRPIYLLKDDRPSRLSAAVDFDATPFRSHSPSPRPAIRSRLLDDADSWALWRSERLGLEQALARDASGRTPDADALDALRERLSDLERRFCDARPDDILRELDALQREILANPGEAQG